MAGLCPAGQDGSGRADWRVTSKQLARSGGALPPTPLFRPRRSAAQLTTLLTDSPVAGLLDKPGIGTVTAAIAFAACLVTLDSS